MILAMGFLQLMERMKARIMKRGHGCVEGGRRIERRWERCEESLGAACGE